MAGKITVISRDCFGNARKAIELLSDEASFVMGLAHGKTRLIRHAWNELDGEVIDPTWAHFPEEEIRYEAKHRLLRWEAIKRFPIPPYGGQPMCGVPLEVTEWYEIEETTL